MNPQKFTAVLGSELTLDAAMDGSCQVKLGGAHVAGQWPTFECKIIYLGGAEEEDGDEEEGKKEEEVEECQYTIVSWYIPYVIAILLECKFTVNHRRTCSRIDIVDICDYYEIQRKSSYVIECAAWGDRYSMYLKTTKLILGGNPSGKISNSLHQHHQSHHPQ